ncbi:uncharacterized protein V1518DRAFT_420946 [Limtongia smithiae]|uniref:uncharacterized protein n=1 Tax=Limtongia smithiae TaxID=1125753 RepID=UPI0034CF5168
MSSALFTFLTSHFALRTSLKYMFLPGLLSLKMPKFCKLFRSRRESGSEAKSLFEPSIVEPLEHLDKCCEQSSFFARIRGRKTTSIPTSTSTLKFSMDGHGHGIFHHKSHVPVWKYDEEVLGTTVIHNGRNVKLPPVLRAARADHAVLFATEVQPEMMPKGTAGMKHRSLRQSLRASRERFARYRASARKRTRTDTIEHCKEVTFERETNIESMDDGIIECSWISEGGNVDFGMSMAAIETVTLIENEPARAPTTETEIPSIMDVVSRRVPNGSIIIQPPSTTLLEETAHFFTSMMATARATADAIMAGDFRLLLWFLYAYMRIGTSTAPWNVGAGHDILNKAQ